MKKIFAVLLSLAALLPNAKAQYGFSSELNGWCGSTSFKDCPTFTRLMVGPASLCGSLSVPEWSRIGTPSQYDNTNIFLCAQIQNNGFSALDYTCEGLFTTFNFVPGVTYKIHVGVLANDNPKSQIRFYSTDNLRQYPFPSKCQDPYIQNMVPGTPPDQVTQSWVDDLASLGYAAPQIHSIGNINLPAVIVPGPGSAAVDYVLTYTATQPGSQLAFHAAMTDRFDNTQINTVIDYIRIEYPCDATFTYTSSTQDPSQVVFTPNAPNYNAGYDWNFGDGTNVHVTLGHPITYHYSAGSYFACLSTSADNINSCNYCMPICIAKISNLSDLPPSTSCNSDFSYSIYSATPNVINFSALGFGNAGYVWDFGDGAMLYGNNPAPSHTYASGGTYTICLITYDAKGNMCSRTCATLCINDPQPQSAISKKPLAELTGPAKADIYPNPVQNEATVKLSLPASSDVKITIFDATGKKVYEDTKGSMAPGIYETAINTRNWTPGFYYISIDTGSGNIVKMLSVVK